MEKQIVFIIGCPRSGTTWLGNSLGKEPDIKYYNEPAQLSMQGKIVFGERDFLDFIKEVKKLCLCEEKNVVIKFPHLTLFVERLFTMFDKAKYIHMIRNADKVAMSLLNERMGNTKSNYHNAWFIPLMSEDMQKLYKNSGYLGKDYLTWNFYVSKALSAKNFGAGNYIEVKYDELVSDTEGEIERLVEWLN